MTTKQIKQLASISFADNKLDDKKISFIAAKLKRTDVREYVKMVQMMNGQRTVTVQSAQPADQSVLKQLSIRFPDKKILYTIDKQVLAGMRIIDNDILYDYSLDNKLDTLIKHLYDTND